jgi:hypothetical protein
MTAIRPIFDHVLGQMNAQHGIKTWVCLIYQFAVNYFIVQCDVKIKPLDYSKLRLLISKFHNILSAKLYNLE